MGTRALLRIGPALRAAVPLVTVLSAAPSCSSTGSEPQFAGGTDATVLLPGPGGTARLPPPSSEPEELPGIDTSDLVRRERSQWWKLVSQLYAPCSDQAVSIAQCVKEARSCAACPAAARMLATRVRMGATAAECEGAYGARFGPNVKMTNLGDSPSKGPDDAPVTIVVWSDFQCPACRHAMPILEAAFKKHSPRVRLVHKLYPLPVHTNAEGAAKAAVAAHNQGHYWQLEELMFDNQQALGEADLERYAKSLRLDLARFRADAISERTQKIIERDKAEADKAGLSGTPFILINGREFDTRFFRLDNDFNEWIALEVDLAQKSPPAQKIADPAASDASSPPKPADAAPTPKIPRN